MPSRRDLLKVVGPGVAGVAVGTATGSSAAHARRASLMAFAGGFGSEAPWCLVAPLQTGSSVGKGWRLEALSRVCEGASIMTLRHSVHGAAKVHICARSGNDTGLSHSTLLDLRLMDGGDGSRPTPEGLARVVTGIAKRIAKNELGAVDESTLDAMARMLTHEQRKAFYGPENLL
ncbi:MAG: twin-arginine translocation signal domain-containing protein [Myxococcota bacterium]|nr:twin-arginine translocation signal domain-containing protein [Myxococcota bacterium]